MVEEITIYRCPFCKAEYQSKEIAEECCINHASPKEFIDWAYNQYNEYPEKIKVGFGDGKRIAFYTFKRFEYPEDIEKIISDENC